MNILVSNDDGCQAPGLRYLAEACKGFGSVSVVAPDRDRSGASNSLTLDRPLRTRSNELGYTCVNGTPTDCVHLAMTCLLQTLPDMVVSGINAGANLGDDVLYSGTVAAAMEGRFLGRPAIAFSINAFDPNHFDTAAKVVKSLLMQLTHEPLPSDTILNVNIPDVPWPDIQGFQTTRLGHRHRSEAVMESLDPRGRKVYWIGAAGSEQDAGPGTDFHAVNHHYVSITPLQVDLTQHHALDALKQWVSGVGQ
jgi:5'-nucleotidase